MADTLTPFIIGWEEWLSLPGLGLPAIKAKIDTGARTSSLHAFKIEPFGPLSQPMVRFGVHPVPGRRDIEIICSAPIVGRREVTSSNGERDTRYFIVSDVSMGGRTWPIEISLSNRETMAYRMLLGRQAIRDDMMVDPAASFLQPRLGYRIYRQLPRTEPVRRTLRMAVLTRAPSSPTNRALRAAADRRGHVLECLDPSRLDICFDDLVPGLRSQGATIPHYDAVIPRIGVDDGARGAALVRQFEMMGSFSVNSGDALDRRANRFAMVQRLVRAGLPSRLPADVLAIPASARLEPPRAELAIRFLVVGGDAVAAVQNKRGAVTEAGAKRLRVARRLAEKAAVALQLGLCSIDLEGTGTDLAITGLSVRPALTRYQRGGDSDIAEKLIDFIESLSRPRHGSDAVRRLSEAAAGASVSADPADDPVEDAGSGDLAENA